MTQRSETGEAVVRRLVGVYDADGTMIGELRYFIGARFGRAHCALCDITHGLVRAKPEWRAGRECLPVPFDTVHRDELPDALRRSDLALPAVVADTDSGFVPLLGPAALERCHGSVDALFDAIEQARLDHALEWGKQPSGAA